MMNLDKMFTYHPPSEEQAPLYAAVRAACSAVDAVFSELHTAAYMDMLSGGGEWSPAMYGRVNAACKAVAEAIRDNCPPCADRDAAIQHVRLVRNACNELIATRMRTDHGHTVPPHLLSMARNDLLRARWFASSAIALAPYRRA